MEYMNIWICRKIIASLSSSTDSGVGFIGLDAFMGILERRGVSSPKPSKRYIPVKLKGSEESSGAAFPGLLSERLKLLFSFYANVELARIWLQKTRSNRSTRPSVQKRRGPAKVERRLPE